MGFDSLFSQKMKMLKDENVERIWEFKFLTFLANITRWTYISMKRHNNKKNHKPYICHRDPSIQPYSPLKFT